MLACKRWFPFVISLLLLTGCGSNPTPVATSYTYSSLGISLTGFPIPTPESLPFGITTGPDGNLWFTESNASKIGRITPTGTITETIPIVGSGALTTGPDGNLWLVQAQWNAIERIHLKR